MNGTRVDNLGALHHIADRKVILNLTANAKQTLVVLNFFAIAARS
jgi:hypothetical protein